MSSSGPHGGGGGGGGHHEKRVSSSAATKSESGTNSSEELNKDISLKFLFANLEGVHVILKFSKATVIGQVKHELMQNWPTPVPAAPAPASIRLFCMGRSMADDTATLQSYKLPEYPMFPTPVNVFVSRKSAAVTVKEAPVEPPPPKSAPSSSSSCGCILS